MKTNRSLKVIAFLMILVILLLSILLLDQISDSSETTPSTPTISPPPSDADAIVLTDPQKKLDEIQYDILMTQNDGTLFSDYTPVPNRDTISFWSHNNNVITINRTLTLSSGVCHYGLIEKEEQYFAFFSASIDTVQDAETLCHRLLCYRDYFPIALVGTISSDAAKLIESVCRMTLKNIGDLTVLTANLTAQEHTESGTLLLNFTECSKTLSLTGKMVALTYDDGPSAYTPAILSSLEKYSAKATFFVNGTHVSKYPQYVEQIFSCGFEIGNHTNLHELFPENTQSIIRQTIEETNRKIRDIVGIGSIVVRPPGGNCNDRYNNPVSVGYPLILWRIDTLDYESWQTKEGIMNSIRSIQSGDIVLMHDTQQLTAETTEEILAFLKEAGFQPVTVSELLEFAGSGATNDTIYRKSIKESALG